MGGECPFSEGEERRKNGTVPFSAPNHSSQTEEERDCPFLRSKPQLPVWKSNASSQLVDERGFVTIDKTLTGNYILAFLVVDETPSKSRWKF
jgi:hypothetical protein